MPVKIIVLDANIAIKVLYDEPDSDIAKEFLQTCTTKDVHILVPEHFLYEIINVCQRLRIEVSQPLTLFNKMRESILTVIAPDDDTWLLAEKIANDGHKKSGFPSMYDSIYHALAITSDAMFVTADKRHYAKSKTHGNILLLKDWKDFFSGKEAKDAIGEDFVSEKDTDDLLDSRK